jgi:rhodanese-related sulfurtransferase
VRLFWWLPFGQVPEIDARELHARMTSGSAPQIVDVRTAAEFGNSRIAGAVNAPVTELKARLSSLALDRNRPVVAVCRSAHRSIPAVRLLRARGYDACQLQKGMQAWWGVGLPVEGESPGAG